jgi:ATP-dependent DNA ligase
MVFDVLPLECLSGDKSWESEIYTQRRHILTEAFFALEKVCEGTDGTALRQVHMAPSYLASSEEEIWHLYENARNAGLEGLIVKNRAGRWVPKRSPDWMKIKNESTEDLPVIGYFEGEGQFAGSLGGLIVRYKDTDVKVGSGFTPAQRAAIWEAVRRDERRIEQGEDTEVLQQLCEVQFQEETEHGSLRHPVFVRMRLDKKEPAF